MSEEDNTKHFLISLFIQQYYREMLSIADEHNSKLQNRVIMFLDEIGTIPKIESIEMMFSASRSRNITIVAIIQSMAQLEKNYGKEGAQIVVENCQDTLYGGFAPNSELAKTLSDSLGTRTVLTKIITTIKSITAKRIFAEHPEVKKQLWGGNFWSGVFLCQAWGAT